ncbi:hypothetical protein GCM10023315_17930 [Algibacter aquimarinus]|uniref:Uncharacterized protein n=1 Tax=Algibacter aquimarinus TaxID=1136748 RepID=A0ABP9HE20_9FLAO
MKTKYFIYTLIIFWLIKIVLAVFQDKIVEYFIGNLKIEPFELGLYAGILNLIFYLPLIGLLIKIALYKNKLDFLNS